MNRKVILASASPRRKELLSRFVKDFVIEAAHIDEYMEDNLPPTEAAINVAKRKVYEIFQSAPEDALIIGADTIVLCNNKIYGKPYTPEKAKEMLMELRGKTHEVVTAVYIEDKLTGKSINFAECTDVKFINFNNELIDKYIATGEPLDRAGSYAIQGIGSILVESIAGDYDNVVGLPIGRLIRELEKIGLVLF